MCDSPVASLLRHPQRRRADHVTGRSKAVRSMMGSAWYCGGFPYVRAYITVRTLKVISYNACTRTTSRSCPLVPFLPALALRAREEVVLGFHNSQAEWRTVGRRSTAYRCFKSIKSFIVRFAKQSVQYRVGVGVQ